MLLSEFEKKEVINLKDCSRLGNVYDLEFDERSGCILKICVREKNLFANCFHNESSVVICYKDIKQIGEDIIIVDMCL